MVSVMAADPCCVNDLLAGEPGGRTDAARLAALRTPKISQPIMETMHGRH
jgi:hypothetical protein